MVGAWYTSHTKHLAVSEKGKEQARENVKIYNLFNGGEPIKFSVNIQYQLAEYVMFEDDSLLRYCAVKSRRS
jgi:hypothetical protein